MEGVLWSCVLVSIVSVWVWFQYKKMKKKRQEEEDEGMKKIPKGDLGWPLIGETIEFIASGYSSPVLFMEKRKSLYGRVFKSNIMGIPIIVSTDPEVNRVVLHNTQSIFTPAYPKSITQLLGETSILKINGPLQKRVHSVIGSFLRSPHFKTKVTTAIQNALRLSLSTLNFNKPIYLQDLAKQITFQVLVRVLMSISPGQDMDFLKKEFQQVIKGLISLPINIPGTRHYRSMKAKERLTKFVTKIVSDKKMKMDSDRDDERGPPSDAVEALLRDVGNFTNPQYLPLDFITGNIIEMMIPGEETLPTAMTLAVKYLTDCPNSLNKLLEENMELKRRKESSREEYTWIDYMSLPFTQNVITETLRLGNIVNAVWRKALADTEINGYLIPKGWGVLVSFSSVHMDQQTYPNPQKFDPWRWEKKGVANNTSFTAFGGGQRLCPGLELSRLEIAIFLHHFVTTYRWVAEKDEIVYFPTVRLKRKLPITITPISAI